MYIKGIGIFYVALSKKRLHISSLKGSTKMLQFTGAASFIYLFFSKSFMQIVNVSVFSNYMSTFLESLDSTEAE